MLLVEKMKEYPCGTWITLQEKSEKEDVNLICIGYRLKRKEKLCAADKRDKFSIVRKVI